MLPDLQCFMLKNLTLKNRPNGIAIANLSISKR